MDDRDLNYEKYFTEGLDIERVNDDYHSHNTKRLNIDEVKKVLLSLPEVRDRLQQFKVK